MVHFFCSGRHYLSIPLHQPSIITQRTNELTITVGESCVSKHEIIVQSSYLKLFLKVSSICRSNAEPSSKSEMSLAFFCPWTRVWRLRPLRPRLGTPNITSPTQEWRITLSSSEFPAAARRLHGEVPAVRLDFKNRMRAISITSIPL